MMPIGNFEDPSNQTIYNLSVKGIINSDGHEDNQIFVNLQVAQSISNRPGKVHTVQVSALCNECPVDTFAYDIQGAIPYVEARTVKQLVSAEMNILEKIEDMMFLVTIVALIASALGVMTTMTTSVIERKKEIGLMKSIGAQNSKIITLFLSEAAIIGILGGFIGFIIGIILSQFIGLSVFNTTISSRLEVFPPNFEPFSLKNRPGLSAHPAALSLPDRPLFLMLQSQTCAWLPFSCRIPQW